MLLANFGNEATVEPIVGKLSQETLAEMVGTTRSRVSFFMNKFRKLGYIEYNGKLEIRNSLLNVLLYDKPEIRKNDGSDGPRQLPGRDRRLALPPNFRLGASSPQGLLDEASGAPHHTISTWRITCEGTYKSRYELRKMSSCMMATRRIGRIKMICRTV